jgi:hypothetical protein
LFVKPYHCEFYSPRRVYTLLFETSKPGRTTLGTRSSPRVLQRFPPTRRLFPVAFVTRGPRDSVFQVEKLKHLVPYRELRFHDRRRGFVVLRLLREKCQSRVGRVLDDVWTNSHRNRSEQSPALEIKQCVADLGKPQHVPAP